VPNLAFGPPFVFGTSLRYAGCVKERNYPRPAQVAQPIGAPTLSVYRRVHLGPAVLLKGASAAPKQGAGASNIASSATGSLEYLGHEDCARKPVKGLYAFEWGELVRILGGFGRDGQVTPPV
jgi:hypothetical protein